MFLYIINKSEFQTYHSGYHGTGGYLTVTEGPWKSTLGLAFLEAGVEMGYPLVDANGDKQTGKKRDFYFNNFFWKAVHDEYSVLFCLLFFFFFFPSFFPSTSRQHPVIKVRLANLNAADLRNNWGLMMPRVEGKNTWTVIRTNASVM
jgi:hypothetical protein